MTRTNSPYKFSSLAFFCLAITFPANGQTPEGQTSIGNTENERMCIQCLVQHLGYDPQGIDAKIGPKTRSALLNQLRDSVAIRENIDSFKLIYQDLNERANRLNNELTLLHDLLKQNNEIVVDQGKQISSQLKNVLAAQKSTLDLQRNIANLNSMGGHVEFPIDLVSIAGVVVALSSFFLAGLAFMTNQKMSKASEVMRLHELWWGSEYKTYREAVNGYVEDFNDNGQADTPLIMSYGSRNDEYKEEKRMIAFIAFFFADMNVMIDERIISKKLAFRIFGEAQFFWFRDFFLAVATRIDELHRSSPEDKVVRWTGDVRALNEKFQQCQRA